jgi:hypothetical protein
VGRCERISVFHCIYNNNDKKGTIYEKFPEKLINKINHRLRHRGAKNNLAEITEKC